MALLIRVGRRSGFEVRWSDEPVRAYLDWLAIVTRDEIALLWPQVEKVAHALVSSVAPLTWWRTTRRGSHAALGTVNHEAIRALGSLAATSPQAKAEPDGLEAKGRAVAVVLPCSWRALNIAELTGCHGVSSACQASRCGSRISAPAWACQRRKPGEVAGATILSRESAPAISYDVRPHAWASIFQLSSCFENVYASVPVRTTVWPLMMIVSVPAMTA